MQESEYYQKNIKKFYLSSVFIGFGFFYIVIQSLYLRGSFLSFGQIGLLVSSTLITTLLLQIPTGHFADLFGKKKSVLISTFVKFLAILFIISAHNFYGFLIGFIFFGIGSAFSSGANSSLLYQSLSKMGQKETYLNHRGRMESLYLIGDIGASAFAPFLFSVNARVPYFVALAALFLAFLVQLSLYEKKEVIGQKKPNLREKLLSAAKNRETIFFIILSGILFVVITFFANVVQSPLFVEVKHFTLSQFSLLGLISSFLLVLSISFISTAERKLGVKKSLLLMITIIPLSLLSMTLVTNLYALALILSIYLIATSFGEIVIENYIHMRIDDSNRATILSLNSMFSSLFAFLLIPLLGTLVDSTSLSSGIIFCAVGLFFISGILIFLNRSKIFATDSRIA